MDSILASAFVAGLLGGVHCVAMCGGILAALNLRPRPEHALLAGAGGGASGMSASWAAQVPLHLAYSAGRVAAYAAAGAVAGSVGGAMLGLQTAVPIQLALGVLAHGMVLLLGLYLAGLGRGVAALERLGSALWRHVAPFGHRLLPADTLPRALGVGAVWGWLPCGLVYSVLTLALLSGGAVQGAAVMLAFGLGTVPNVLGAGVALGRLGPALRQPGVRLAAGLAIAALGAWGLARTPGLGERLREGLLCLT